MNMNELNELRINQAISLLQEVLESNKSTSFDVHNCTEKELIRRCQELHFSEENTNLAIEFFIKKTKHSVLADKLFVQEKTVTTRKKRMKEKLNN